MHPSVRRRSARDRHGRGSRSPLFFPGTPAWRTRREDFDLLVSSLVAELADRWPAVSSIEFATEDVPPSAPAPWDTPPDDLPRNVPAAPRPGLRDRNGAYRLPLVLRCAPTEVEGVTRRLLVERISHVLALPPDEVDDLLR